ncbi:MAG: iron dependent repressor, metal binding and dimerization domain protein [Euryarchaeota archaeon]|nr:iron dependent repressor, metal binding and dimerization domain protein [Euryarchaeota archaeon]
MGKTVTKSIEDYLKTIYVLTEEKDVTRISDLSLALDVQPPSVTEMIQKMDRRGFVSHEKYRGVRLTEKGKKLAKSVKTRNKTLLDFLTIIGVNEKTAKEDACEMEHELNPTTMDCLTGFVKFVQSSPKNPRWLNHFKYYRKTGKHKECKDEAL